MSAFLLFHNGWTDIMNSLGLISHFAELHYPNKLYISVRKDASKFINFYVKKYENIDMLYLYSPYPQVDDHQEIMSKCEHIHLIGMFDDKRPINDIYKGAWSKNNMFFVNKFYHDYGLDINDRINKFSFDRDFVMEMEKKKNVIGDLNNYVIYHDRPNLQITDKKLNWINLDCISEVFFDCISIIEGAESIHLIDSVWAAFCYLLDCKYGLFKNKKIYIYCRPNDNLYNMFMSPRTLDNWTIYRF